MMRGQLILIAAIVCMSFAVGATIFDADIAAGSGVLDFSDVPSGLLVGNIEFTNAQWGLVDTFVLSMDIAAVSAPDLGVGQTAYTSFLNLGVLSPVGLTFDSAILTIMIDECLCDVVVEGLMYYSDDGGVTWNAQTAQIVDIDGVKAIQTAISHFSIWGGGGDDPTIPDPSIASIIGCGMLMLGRRFKS
jgi:hypothetical protein